MAVTTDPYTNTDAVAFIPEVWSSIVNEPNFPKAVAANFFTDLSEFVADGGDIIHVPDIYTNTFTANTQSTQGAEVTTESVASVDTTLTVNTHKYVAWIMGDLTLQQLARMYSLNEKYAREAQGLLMQALEDALFGLWSSVTTNTVGDTATALVDSELRQAIEKLDTLNYLLEELAWFFHPYVFWNQLGGIAKLYEKQISDLSFIKTGNFGPMDASRGLRGVIYGIPVFTSSRVVSGLQTYRNLLAHPSALGFAIQTRGTTSVAGDIQAPNRIRTQAENELRNLGTLVVVDIIYGVAALREEAAVLVNASSSFLVS